MSGDSCTVKRLNDSWAPVWMNSLVNASMAARPSRISAFGAMRRAFSV